MELKYHISLSLRQDAKVASHWPRCGVMWTMHHKSLRHISHVTQKYSPVWPNVAAGLAVSSRIDQCMERLYMGRRQNGCPRLGWPWGFQWGGSEVANNRNGCMDILSDRSVKLTDMLVQWHYLLAAKIVFRTAPLIWCIVPCNVDTMC